MAAKKSTNNTDPIAMLAESMDVFCTEMEAVDRLSTKISAKTTRIIRVVVVLLSIISVYLIILTYNMAEDLGTMINSLDEMYVEFGAMSTAMGEITEHVNSLAANVGVMPGIAESVRGINTDVGMMTSSVESIGGNIVSMDSHVGYMGAGTTEMSHRMVGMQQSVSRLQYDLHQSMRPLNSMPW